MWTTGRYNHQAQNRHASSEGFFCRIFPNFPNFLRVRARSRATEECKKARTHLTRVKTRPLLTARRRSTPSLLLGVYLSQKTSTQSNPSFRALVEAVHGTSVEAHETTTFSDDPARWRACFRPSELHNRRRTTRELQIRGKRF